MKKIYPLLLFSLILSTPLLAQKKSKYDKAFIRSLETMDDQEIWSMREQAQNKFQSNIVIGTIVTSWGLAGIGTGAILMSNPDPDITKSGNIFIGAGFGLSLIGLIITSSAAKHRKSDLWMEKELWIRNNKSVGFTPTGIKFQF